MADATPPPCSHCGEPALITRGRSVYPHRPDLHDQWFWRCGPCRAWVGCHGATQRPLGRPANAELRRARTLLHGRLDPLWQRADELPCYRPEDDRARRVIRLAARHRTYAWLADRLGLTREECHVSWFDLEDCRRAWVALRDASAESIRAWHKHRSNRGADNATAE